MMKKWFISSFLGLALMSLLTQAKAEDFYSVAAAYRVNFTGVPLVLEFHRGGIFENFMFRIGADFPLFIFSGDASFIYPIEQSGTRVYIGAGADVGALIISVFGLHAHAGFEFKQETLGVFAEYQISAFVSGMARDVDAPDLVFSKFKVGINFYP